MNEAKLIESIKADICTKHNVTLIDLASRRRTRRIAHAKAEGIYRMSRETELSWSEIATEFGLYDHSSAFYAAKAHEKRAGNGAT